MIVDRHLCAFAREGDCRCATDAGIATGHQRMTALQSPSPFVADFAAIGYGIHVAL
jgi:hypothetical protein